MVKDNLLHLLVNLLLLAKDDITLALNGGVIQGRVLENVGEDLNGLGDIGLEGLGVVDGLLAGSVGVQVSTHVLDLDLEIVLAARAGALLTDEWFRVQLQIESVSFVSMATLFLLNDAPIAMRTRCRASAVQNSILFLLSHR